MYIVPYSPRQEGDFFKSFGKIFKLQRKEEKRKRKEKKEEREEKRKKGRKLNEWWKVFKNVLYNIIHPCKKLS